MAVMEFPKTTKRRSSGIAELPSREMNLQRRVLRRWNAKSVAMNKIDKLVAVLSLSLAFSSVTFAHIGETEEECGKRYGDVMVRQDEGGGIVKIAFAQGDMVVVARFFEGKAVSLNFTQFNDKDEEVPFTTEE